MTKFGKQEKTRQSIHKEQDISLQSINDQVESFSTLTSRRHLSVNEITNFLVWILSITVGLVTED